MPDATAFWIVAPGHGELRSERLPEPGRDDILVETLASGVSRGTETLVFQGRVPESQRQIMRAPHQVGEFTFPLKYGYSSVGLVAAGPDDWLGRRVFCLHPHQDRYVVPRHAVVAVPAVVPAERAVLAANLETVVNALWDAPPRIGDRVAVVGAGVIGALAAAVASKIPGVVVQLVDVNPDKAAIAAALGVSFAVPKVATPQADLVIHASATGEGLATALDLAGFEATIVELSWYGVQSGRRHRDAAARALGSPPPPRSGGRPACRCSLRRAARPACAVRKPAHCHERAGRGPERGDVSGHPIQVARWRIRCSA
jgi:NADPH:quinone reductase-like Zn-dependent oxidoreductase